MATETKPAVQAGSEKDLMIWQQGIVEDAPGGVMTVMSIGVTREGKHPTNPGDITHTLTAPTGFVWNGWTAYAYYGADQQVRGSMAEIKAKVTDGGRKLTFTHNPHVYTDDQDQDALVYILGIGATDDAEPGRYTDGQFRMGKAKAVKLKGRVLDPDED